MLEYAKTTASIVRKVVRAELKDIRTPGQKDSDVDPMQELPLAALNLPLPWFLAVHVAVVPPLIRTIARSLTLNQPLTLALALTCALALTLLKRMSKTVLRLVARQRVRRC